MAKAKGVTVGELSDILRTPVATVRHWQQQGCPFRKVVENGQARIRFDLEPVKAWLDTRGGLRKRGRPAATDGGSEGTKERLALAELRKRLALAERHELELAARKGELLDAREVEAGRLARIAVVKAGLLALPGKLAPQLVGRDAREIETAVMAEVRALLEGFAGGATA